MHSINLLNTVYVNQNRNLAHHVSFLCKRLSIKAYSAVIIVLKSLDDFSNYACFNSHQATCLNICKVCILNNLEKMFKSGNKKTISQYSINIRTVIYVLWKITCTASSKRPKCHLFPITSQTSRVVRSAHFDIHLHMPYSKSQVTVLLYLMPYFSLHF